MDVPTHAAHVLHHQARPPRVADEAEIEENGVPDFESSLNALAPYADGVEDEGEVDDDDGEGIHR